MHQFYDKQYERRKPQHIKHNSRQYERSRSRSSSRGRQYARQSQQKQIVSHRQNIILPKKNPNVLYDRRRQDYHGNNPSHYQHSIDSGYTSNQMHQRHQSSGIRSSVTFNSIKAKELSKNGSEDERYDISYQPPLENQLYLKGQPARESKNHLRCQTQTEVNSTIDKQSTLGGNTKQNDLRQQLHGASMELPKLGVGVQSSSPDSLIVRRYPYQALLEGIPQVSQNSRRKGLPP